MFVHETEKQGWNRRLASGERRGNALVALLVVMVGLASVLGAVAVTSVVEVNEARADGDKVRARYVAEAGIERGMNFLQAASQNSTVFAPLQGLTNLFAVEPTLTAFDGERLSDGARDIGSYSVTLTRVDADANSITVAIDATGYLPVPPDELQPGQRLSARHSQRATVRFSLAPSAVFNYGYFINNWGWFYGDTITTNGNVRSNGQFDAAGYKPTLNGSPMYDSVAWSGSAANLIGYQDDNGDGLTAGNDGGVFAGWDIVGATKIRGNGGQSAHQHDFEEQIPMPNLSNLAMYEQGAKDMNASITIGGVTVCNAVYGDEAGEKQNLYLVGTNANPIQLNGPVVVRGNVMVRGVVTGRGAIYSGRNTYVPNSLTYKNGPSTNRPANNSQASTEAWLTANWNKDFLGLFSRENIVVGNHTDSTWRYYVDWWMKHSMNASKEDQGADGIPHTKKGRDGIAGTADDDVLEGDGVFTVSRYTQADADLGLIPPGFNINDIIPGSGEDIDGDGKYDGQSSLADIDLNVPLDTANWGGNMPSAGIGSYSSIASMQAHRLDAVFYTNHAFCWTVLGSQPATINGALVSRNENIIYGTPSMVVNHDSRLLGGSAGRASNLLPMVVQPMELLRWAPLEADPHMAMHVPCADNLGGG